jgi:hypothetical protein
MLIHTPDAIRIVEQGCSLPHRKLTPHQKAVTAANILDGYTFYQPTLKQLAQTLGVAPAYIRRAMTLSPEARRAVLEDGDRHPVIFRSKSRKAEPTISGSSVINLMNRKRVA